MQVMSIRIFLMLFILIFIYPSSLIAGAERRQALVIGNGGYSSSPLKNAVNDATDIASNLQRLGFSVILKKNVSHQEMEDAILEFGEQLKKGGVGLFFYAGHGVQKDSRNYLIPIGARINKDTDIKFQAVDAEMVLAEMGNAGNNLNIVILDACRDNPFSKSFRTASRGLAIISDAPKGTFITYSTSPGKVAADGSGRNSPYTESLIKYMNTKGLPIEEVFKEVRKDLGRKTGGQQVPWELSSLEGQFYFSPGKSVKSDTAAKDELDDENQKLEAEQQRLEKEKVAFAKQKALDEKRQQIAEERERLAAEKEEARQAAMERQKQKKSTITAKATYQPTSGDSSRDERYIAYDRQSKQETGFDDNEIRVGQWGPQTGPAAAWGAVARGSKLVFDIVNEEGGIHGRQIKYFIRDDQYNPSQTVAGVKELVEKYGIFAFVGGVGSAAGQAVQGYLLEKEIIWISPCSGHASFYKPFNPYLWNMWPSYENDASVLTKFAVETKKFKKIAMFYQNDDYGLLALDSVKHRLSQFNMELVAAVPVEPTERDLSPQIQKLKSSRAQAVIAFVSPVQATIILKTAVAIGFKTQWIHSSNLGDFGLMNKITGGLWASEGVITSAFTQSPSADNPISNKYVTAAKRLAPSERWGIFYMSGIVVAEPLVFALKKVGRNLSTKVVQNELNKIKNFQGIGPKVTWTATNHNAPKSLQIWQCSPDGKEIILQDWTENEISRN